MTTHLPTCPSSSSTHSDVAAAGSGLVIAVAQETHGQHGAGRDQRAWVKESESRLRQGSGEGL